MAIVSRYGTGYRDPASLVAIEGIQRRAEKRTVRSKITLANGDNATSTVRFGTIPTNAKLDPKSLLYYGAITGLTDFDLGLAYPNGGAVIVKDCIINGQDVHTAGSTTLSAATGSGVATPANMEKAAWQIAGLSSDPGGEFDVIGTLNADTSASADLLLLLDYNIGV